MSLKSKVIATSPFEGQKPGTSGLRKKVKVFMEKNYTENFIQSIFDAIGKEKVQNSTIVVGGDGRYYGKQAVQIIIRMAAANGVKKLIVGNRGLISTPASSNLIRKRNALGGFILTASHNPGGINQDFGIKYNCENGGSAPEQFTDKVWELSKTIKEYKICREIDCYFDTPGVHNFEVDDRKFQVEVIDPVDDYVQLMKTIFDFGALKHLAREKQFKINLDSMNGVTGPYSERIFMKELGFGQDCVRRIIPLDNFGEIHPDPNLTYAADLVKHLQENSVYDFGAAFDGDGDRNMILGKRAFFVPPSDSLAVLANNLQCIPYFTKGGIKGFARSMPTAAAVDRVAEKLNKEMFVVPTGWKYFGNLMDANRLSLCGEESFGTGSDHIREKDGIWAVLAWLSVIAHKNMSVEEILKEHWSIYGRNYVTRYDYEEVALEAAKKMMDHLEKLVASGELHGKTFEQDGKRYQVKIADNFSYKDPIDGSVTKNQGIRIAFSDGSRIVFRLSGTGSSGATIRLYIDSYEPKQIDTDAQVILKPLISIALKLSNLQEVTGRQKPTVIT